ncbi:translation elongation factor Ts [Breoghania sp.]|uniref:translation elongation factor Ts n=1 Tax=Breoghania sp. TaxID=2065378 RepID=UPI00260D8247|nr:translation elongation factor Ts [Breoghania sp.]MDJ0929687.1 translation elongation factor Ts [Breoghania sp.]
MIITAAMVKELREKTGAGMMDCKNALSENGGGMEAAVDWLHTKGLAKAAKKAGRVAAEGFVGVAADGNKASVVEVNSETDFVARNENFQSFVAGVSKAALDVDGDVEKLAASTFPGKSETIEATLKDLIATIGENMTLRRAATVSVNNGVVATYMHNAAADDIGKIGVLVGLESTGDAEKLFAFGRHVAMHIAATNPLALNADELDPDVVVRERHVYAYQARESGKPDNIVEKMVEGRMRKFYEESTLLKQPFVIDPDKTVEAAVVALAGELGTDVKITSFVRFALGEGIEKEEMDFAAEVAAATFGN